MMSFGWRPMLSCYATQEDQLSGNTTSSQQVADAQQTAAVQASSCAATPTWFFTLLAIAAGAGLMNGGRK